MGECVRGQRGDRFYPGDGQRVSANAVSKAFLRAQAGLGLPRVTIHGLRHSYGRSCSATACRWTSFRNASATRTRA